MTKDGIGITEKKSPVMTEKRPSPLVAGVIFLTDSGADPHSHEYRHQSYCYQVRSWGTHAGVIYDIDESGKHAESSP